MVCIKAHLCFSQSPSLSVSMFDFKMEKKINLEMGKSPLYLGTQVMADIPFKNDLICLHEEPVYLNQ